MVTGALLAATAVLVAIFAVLIYRQGPSFGDRAAAVDPTGPENNNLHTQATDATVFLAVVAAILALALILSIVLVLRRPLPEGAPGRRLAVLVIAVAGLIYPVRVAFKRGIGVHLIAIPHTYDGDNAVRVTMEPGFQSTVTKLADAIALMLVAVIVLLFLPASRRFFRVLRSAPEDNYNLSALARRQSD